MKRVNILWLLLDSLFLIVFNFLFFALGDAANTPNSVWISYGFIHFAYILLLLTPFLIRKSNVEYIYRRPPFFVTSSYFLVQLAVGVTLILIAPETAKTTIIIQVVLAAIFLAWLLAHLIANEHTASKAEVRETELKYVKESSAKLKQILQRITDQTTAKQVEKVYDLMRSSPILSNADVYQLEQQVIEEIKQLENAVSRNELEKIATIANKVYRLAEERNSKLKLLNK